MAAQRSTAVELFWKIHPRLYRWSGGRIGGRLMNMPVLLLTTQGAKSGRVRENALMYLAKGDACVVIASVLGEARHPAWLHNLRAHPEARVQVGARAFSVRARETTGEERQRLWEEVVAAQADYAEYAKRTTRRIPIVVLEPLPARPATAATT